MLFIEALETVKCLDEGVIESVADANIGSIFGIGFPGWTGGVLQYINGYDGRPVRLRRPRARAGRAYGDRFTPPASLVEKAERGEPYSGRRRWPSRPDRSPAGPRLMPAGGLSAPCVDCAQRRCRRRCSRRASRSAAFPGFIAGFVAALLGIDRLLDRMHGFGGWGMDDAERRFDRLVRERRRHPVAPARAARGHRSPSARRIGVEPIPVDVDRRHRRPAQGGGVRRPVPPAAVRPRPLEPDVPRGPGGRADAADLRLPGGRRALRPRRPPPRVGGPRARRRRHRRRRDGAQRDETHMPRRLSSTVWRPPSPCWPSRPGGASSTCCSRSRGPSAS